MNLVRILHNYNDF
uniref:Uncharacterized protein n=1 Tax=Rhizophora mucronata TaxID=61149 RepID=A0A2P2P492_RHIMU